MPLEFENKLQVFRFHPVIEEAVVADLLESARQHMHQETADELRVWKGEGPSVVPGFLPLAEKVVSLSVTERMRLFEMATLCVYFPRYSTALPNPRKASFI